MCKSQFGENQLLGVGLGAQRAFLVSQYKHLKRNQPGNVTYSAGVRAKTTENKNTTSIFLKEK